MVRYAAFLRGISPLNPNMKNERLREVFAHEELENVQTVISSGNVLFESASKNVDKLEAMIEKALPEQLGFNSTTVILSEAELKRVAEHSPFQSKPESDDIRWIAAFTKQKPKKDIPQADDAKGFGILGVYDRTIYCQIDLSANKTPELMRWLEKTFSKELTTRNWNTIERILKKWDNKK